MGLSDVATHLIWLVVLVGAAAAGTAALEGAASDALEATQFREDATLELANLRLLDVSFCYVGSSQTVSVNATNAGETRINATRVSLVIDGIPYAVSTTEVAGIGSTTRWLPGEAVYLNRTSVASQPDTLVIVLENGVRAYATPIACPSTVHVSALSTYLSGAPASTFRKGRDTVETRVTVVDASSSLVSGATVTIELEDSNGALAYSGSAVTNGAGVASISYALPASAAHGAWIDRVTSVTGAGMTYDAGANVVTQIGFTVTP